MGPEDEKKAGNASPAAVAAALAVLGLSVGVNVPDLLAASPQDQIRSNSLDSKQNKARLKSHGEKSHEGKIEGLQNKAKGSFQQKVSPTDQSQIPSLQNKAGGVPSLQNKAGGVPSLQNKAAGVPSRQNKAGGIPSLQNKAGGVPSLQNKAGGVPE